MVDWICGYENLNTGEPCIEKAGCKLGFLGGSDSKESAYNAGDSGDLGSILGLGRSPGGRHGNPLKYCCLGNPKDRGAWWATVHGTAKSGTRLKQLSMHTGTEFCELF